jgi:hypothetical protein
VSGGSQAADGDLGFVDHHVCIGFDAPLDVRCDVQEILAVYVWD